MRRGATLSLALVATVAIGVPAAAQQTPPAAAPSSHPSDATLHAPHWARRPSADDIGRVYPPQARRDSTDGQAEMTCLVAPDGHLRDCAVLHELPEGQGFGAATLKLAPLFRMGWKNGPPPLAVDGSEGTVRIPVRFEIAR
jgi:protein TonB